MRILYIVLILQASYIGNFLVSAFKCLSSEWCLNGGTCDLETGICTCLPGWTEENCDTFSGCLLGGNFSCQNGGTCINNENNGRCACVEKFTGINCERSDGCASGITRYSCLNGGTCFSSTGLCLCSENYSGKNCDEFIGCLAAGLDFTCRNNGTCVNSSGIGVCECKTKWSGKYCETHCSSLQYFGCMSKVARDSIYATFILTAAFIIVFIIVRFNPLLDKI